MIPRDLRLDRPEAMMGRAQRLPAFLSRSILAQYFSNNLSSVPTCFRISRASLVEVHGRMIWSRRKLRSHRRMGEGASCEEIIMDGELGHRDEGIAWPS